MADLSVKLGQRIKELRKKCKMTQAQLAEAIGMETTNLCKLENGSHLPKEENIERFADVFGVDIKDLFDFGHVKPIHEIQNELIKIIKNSSREKVTMLYKIINALNEGC